jgi:uncharacterized protein (TIGR04255 family)
MQFAPLVRVTWKSFPILVGDKSICIVSEIPYCGWVDYKNAILEVITAMSDIPYIESVQRYSMKYVNLIPCDDLAQQILGLNFELRIGQHKIEKEAFLVRTEIQTGSFLKMIQVAAGASVVKADGKTTNGAIVEIDIARQVDDESPKEFIKSFSPRLDEIHMLNKETFFDCLQSQTIEALGPTYE